MSIFSPDDIKTICTLFKGGKMVNPLSFTLMVVTAKGTQYLLKIEHAEKFARFSEKVLAFGSLRLYTEVYTGAYKIAKTNTKAQNEQRFLQYISQTSGGAGLKLFRGNSTFSQWVPLGLDENNNVIVEPCR